MSVNPKRNYNIHAHITGVYTHTHAHTVDLGSETSQSSGKIDFDGFFNPSSHLTRSDSLAFQFALQHPFKAKTREKTNKQKKTNTSNVI